MAALKRFLTFCLAVAFLIGATVQLVPCAVADANSAISTGNMSGCDGAQPPCTGHIPNCLEHGGCITMSALPASLDSVAVPVDWTSLDYNTVPESLAGISVEPELAPPILAA